MIEFEGNLMVGGTGIEPVTPTMSRFAAYAKPLKYMAQTASKLADGSLYVAMNTGQSRAKRGRDVRIPVVLKQTQPDQQVISRTYLNRPIDPVREYLKAPAPTGGQDE
jgi:hypothetical protein